MLRTTFTALSLVFLVIAGCGPAGPKTVPVTGTLLHNGAAVEGVSVTFLSGEGNRVATGTTDAAGKFSLKTVVGSQMLEGAVPGEHKVGVAKTTSEGGGAEAVAGESPQEMVNRMAGAATDTSKIKQTFVIPKKYNSPEYSGLTATVTESGPNNIELITSGK